MLAALAGCTRRPAAPAPLTAALADARAAMSSEALGAAATPCLRLSSQLQAFSSAPELPDATRAHLKNLASAVADFSGEGLQGVDPRSEWRALDLQLTRVLEGKDPGPGPRFRRDLPADLRQAIGVVDAALARQELTEACASIDETTMLLSQWRWAIPAPRALGSVRRATERLDAMPTDCRSAGIPSVKRRFDDAVALLGPDAP